MEELVLPVNVPDVNSRYMGYDKNTSTTSPALHTWQVYSTAYTRIG